ncbi:hypothetical protein SLEP1_g41527 [Rubroshorea leprosula]|uniref:Uncharacterized protein n=1 Tax=Rubroshorea leprosula TaxID=152421 RepID=A0AAV5L861_9ROSI|nr:hypothetical protein SLEP1_g41527 [Rubroshorea leprosula]
MFSRFLLWTLQLRQKTADELKREMEEDVRKDGGSRRRRWT